MDGSLRNLYVASYSLDRDGTDALIVKHHYVDSKKFVTKSSKKRIPLPPHPKGFVNYDQIIDRPLEEILRDYIKLIRKHKDDFTAHRSGTPQFIPARRPGPIIPSEKSIAAFSTLVEGENMKRYDFLMQSSQRTITAVRTIQRFILHPTEDNLRPAMEILDDCRFSDMNQSPFRSLSMRKTFAAIPADPFDASAHLAILEKSKVFKATRIDQQEATSARVELLVQYSKITGRSFATYELDSLVAGAPIAARGRPHWATSFYKSEGIGLLIQLYVGQSFDLSNLSLSGGHILVRGWSTDTTDCSVKR